MKLGGEKVEMAEFVNYGNEIVIPSDTTHNVALNIIETIKKELPEEAQCVSVINEILSDVKTIMETSKLKL